MKDNSVMQDKKRGGGGFGSIGLVLLGVLALVACGTHRGVEKEPMRYPAVSPHAPRIVLLSFENLSEHPHAGAILTRLMGTELYRQGVFDVREEKAGLHVSTEERNGGAIPSTGVRRLAETLGADAVLLGSVTEYHYQHGLREEPVVGLSVRLVRSCDRQVIWAASRGEEGEGLFRRESLNQVAQRLVRELVGELAGKRGEVLECGGVSHEAVDPSGASEGGET